MGDVMLYLGLSGILKNALYYYWRDRMPREAVLAGHVTKLALYPVKSMREVDLGEMDCDSDTGPHRGHLIDRQWIVIDADNAPVTIRLQPIMNSIRPQYDGATLRLTSPGHNDVTMDVESIKKSGHAAAVKIEGATVTGLDCGDEVAEWLSGLFGGDGYRLLYCSPELSRRHFMLGNKDYNYWTRRAKPEDKLYYQDVSPFHLLSEQSAGELSGRLGRQVDVMQFRPNIVVSATYGPYDEDTWKELFIGKVRFKTIKLCDRCTLPTIDRRTCKRDKDNEPLKTLKSYRSLVPGLGPMFGTDLVVERPGTIRVGDPIYVVRGYNVKLTDVDT